MRSVVVVLTGLGLALPVLVVIDREIFDAVDSAGYGEEWVFELLDPHERLYRDSCWPSSSPSAYAGPGWASGSLWR